MLTEAVHMLFDLAALGGVLLAAWHVRKLQRVLAAAPSLPARPYCSRVGSCSNHADPRCAGGGCMSCCLHYCSPRCSLEFQRRIERALQAEGRNRDRSVN